MTGKVRVGVGGWNYAPWRETFYPAGTKQKDELAYMASRMSAVEVNSTYYSTQKPATFANWAKAAPDGFQFAIKASRFATNRRVLAEAGESVAKVVEQGIVELGDKLGPILWQFMPTKKFDAEDFGAFLALLPARHAGVALRHALEVRHESFDDPAFIALAKQHGCAIVYAEHDDYPLIDADTASFRYARIQQAAAGKKAGYAAKELDRLAAQANQWAAKGDAYLFFISGAKERNPAAALAVQDRL